MVEKKYSLISGCALDSALRAGWPSRALSEEQNKESKRERKKEGRKRGKERKKEEKRKKT